MQKNFIIGETSCSLKWCDQDSGNPTVYENQAIDMSNECADIYSTMHLYLNTIKHSLVNNGTIRSRSLTPEICNIRMIRTPGS